MDSMRSLNKSLPRSHNDQLAPPEQLLQAFRTAALSVTNLYKSAVTNQSSSRQEGYQDALDDLLVFLDTENLGLQDGEGWRVRQWVTERYERAATTHQQNDSDDERSEPEKEISAPSPSEIQTVNEETPQSEQPQRGLPGNLEPALSNTEQADQPTVFKFTAATPNQHDISMQTEETLAQTPTDQLPTPATQAPVRVGFVPRGSRTPHRHGSPRHGTKASTREFTFTTGTKRKLQFPDFFDISNLGPSREGSGGGKRGRYA